MATTTIVLTAYGSLDLAVEAMRIGAYDFLTKPLAATRLAATSRNAVERHRLIAQVEDFRAENEPESLGNLRGSSPAMKRVFQAIRNAASGESSVLVRGEAGTGRMLAAHTLHSLSPRRERPFVVLAPPNLDAAAFTRLLVEANGGTLFVPELCDLPITVQTLLHDFLRDGEVSLPGGATVAADARVVAATARNPKAEIESRRWHVRLLQRLQLLTITLPALRDRAEDVLLLADAFLSEAAKAADGAVPPRLSHSAEVALLAYPWPGNVRELRSVVLETVSGGMPDVITADDLPREIAVLARADQRSGSQHRFDDLVARGTIEPLWKVERDAIERALELCEGRNADAARLLQVSPAVIYRKRRGLQAAAVR